MLYVDVEDSNNVDGTPITAGFSHDSGNNINWLFGTNSVTWVGVGNNWNAAINWDLGYVPNGTDNVTIVATSNDPLTPSNASVGSLTINSGANLDLFGHTLTDAGSLTGMARYGRVGGGVASRDRAAQSGGRTGRRKYHRLGRGERSAHGQQPGIAPMAAEPG